MSVPSVGDMVEWWRESAAQTKRLGGSVQRRVLPESSHLDAWLTFESHSMRAGIRVKTKSQEGVTLGNFDLTRGLRASITSVDGDCEIRISADAYEPADVFATLAADLLAVAGRSNATDAVAPMIVARVKAWQHLLAETGSTGLSKLAQLGLFGELWVLRWLMQNSGDQAACLNAWAGPTGANQDFQWPGGSVEVKATSTVRPEGITISSERQLDPTGAGDLFLKLLEFDVREHGQGESLPEIVHSVRSQIDEAVRGKFFDLLWNEGYRPEDDGRYVDRAYTLRSDTTFLVREGFPRIIEEGLPGGVGTVSYVVSVAACAPFTTDPVEILKAWRSGP